MGPLRTGGPGLLATELASVVPPELEPLARLASNFRWSWMPEAVDLFRSIDPQAYASSGGNPVRLLRDGSLEAAAADRALVERADTLADRLTDELAAPVASVGLDEARPVAFFCAEFAIHPSLPVYAGGLGVLAGDIVKEASDLRLPYVGVGLLYRQGYFRQAIDQDGWQVERWLDVDLDHVAVAHVTDPGGEPLTVEVPIAGRPVVLAVWRADVGRVPLLLLDTALEVNAPEDRAITSRLYVGDPAMRLRQYAVLGFGGMRALRAQGIEPGLLHMNEGHAAFAALELPSRTPALLTTHTPVPAGNETFPAAQVLDVVGGAVGQLGLDLEEVLSRGRVSDAERFELTPFAIRSSSIANGVSRRHGAVARTMWRDLFPEAPSVDDVPIAHVTNGIHLPTWLAPPVRSMLDRHLGEGWLDRAADPDAWRAVDAIPDEEVWSVRTELRATLVSLLRDGGTALDPEALTVGFARRVAAYKRLNLVIHDPVRLGSLPLQLVVAGKAHPSDQDAKGILRSVLAFGDDGANRARTVFVEDYDLQIARTLIAGCDVWINLPTPPLEASGTSGMKAAVNGGLNLSVLDGWWEEAFDGRNGWGIASDPDLDPEARNAADARALYDLLETEVLPLFAARDGAGIPRGWVERIKGSLRTVGPRFSATRMLRDYVGTLYPPI